MPLLVDTLTAFGNVWESIVEDCEFLTLPVLYLFEVRLAKTLTNVHKNGKHQRLLMKNTEQRINIIPMGFDEQYYLVANPDVAQAVSNGQFKSGLDHYHKYGRFENRSFDAPKKNWKQFSRRDRILNGIDLTTASGMEIGALCFPLVTRLEGKIFYVDYAPTEKLAAKYKDDAGVDVSKLVEVDGVWNDEGLLSTVSGQTFDYVVASHVVEHVPDLITWLGEIAKVLKPGGTLRLACPDKRYTFDYIRHETTLPELLASWVSRSRRPTPTQILQHYELSRKINHISAWKRSLDSASLARNEPEGKGLAAAKNALENNAYEDAHCLVTTPHSLALIFAELASMELLNFRCDLFIPTQDWEIEFYMHMSVCSNKQENIDSWRNAAALAITRPSTIPPERFGEVAD